MKLQNTAARPRTRCPRKLHLFSTNDHHLLTLEGRWLFHYNAEGRVDKAIDRRNNEDVVWKKT